LVVLIGQTWKSRIEAMPRWATIDMPSESRRSHVPSIRASLILAQRRMRP
jgi:hypothetical protein